VLSHYLTFQLGNPNSKFRIESLHLFRAILLRKIRICHKNVVAKIEAIQLVTNLWPLGGDDLYSSLFILKIRGFHLKLLQDDLDTDIQDVGVNATSGGNSIDKCICKLVSGITYLKFLVTVVVEDSVVALKTYRVTVKSLKIHPESMRNGLVNLNVEVESARAEQLETNIALRVDKITINAIIQVAPPEIDTFEFIVGDVWLDVPACVAGRYLDKIKVKSHQTKTVPSPAAQTLKSNHIKNSKSILKSLPNVDLQLKRLTVSVVDRSGQALDATLQTVNLTFQTPDTLLAVDVESVGVDFRKRFAQKLLDVRTIKARWSPSILSAIFSHLNLKMSIAQAHSGLDMLGHGMTNHQPQNNKCTVQLAVIQGTLDRPSSEMTVVQVQSLVILQYYD